MHAHFGHLGWWPGDTPFEIAVGAILTQNTSWTNVEKAIENLRREDLLDPVRLSRLPETRLAQHLRPAGYFNIKARRLGNFLKVLVEEFAGDLNRMLSGKTETVRERLLAINGIGPETADSILLYAGTHHSFVVDAYTRRIFERHGWFDERKSLRTAGKTNSRAVYESLKSLCEESLQNKAPADRLDYWRDYHAQIVMVGKEFCRAQSPRCDECPLNPLLP